MPGYTGTPTGGKRPAAVQQPRRRKRAPSPAPYVRPRIEAQPGPTTRTDRSKVREYLRDTGSPADAHSQLRRSGELDARGRQKSLAGERPRPRGERGRIVVDPRGLEHGLRVVPNKLYRELARQGREVARERRSFVRSNPRFADDRLSKPTVRETKVAGLGMGELGRFLSRDTLLGASAPAFAELGKMGLRTTTAPYHAGRAFVESGAVRRESLKGVRDLGSGIVMGPVAAVTDPGGTVRQARDQFVRTYGPLMEGDTREFRERLGEEHSGGVVPVALDFGLGAGIGSRATGSLARAGLLGRGAKEVMTAPRPDLRFSGGAEGVRAQEVSPYLGKAVRQRARDRSRERVYARREVAAGSGDFRPTVRPQSAPVRRGRVLTGGEVVARGGLEVRGTRGRGTVVPTPSRLGTEARLQRQAAAQEKGRRRISLLDEQGALDRLAAATIGRKAGRFGSLSKAQQRAVTYVYRGLMSATSRDGALKQLGERRRQILEERRAIVERGGDAAKQIDPGTLKLKGPRGRFNDELRVIEKIEGDLRSGALQLDELAGPARTMRRREVDLAAGRPDLEQVPDPGRVSQAQLRRYAPQAEYLSRAGKLPEMLDGETPGQFIERVGLRAVVAAARREGLERPGYMPSERRYQQRFSDRAIGGSRGLADDKSYTGSLFRSGMEDTRPEVLVSGLQRSVKRKHNINLIAEQVERHAIELGPTERAKRAAAAARAADAAKPDHPTKGSITHADLLVRVAHDRLEAAERRHGAESKKAQRARAEHEAAVAELDEAIDGARGHVRAEANLLQREAAEERLTKAFVPREGRTVKELVDDLQLAQIDPATVTFFNPGRAYRELRAGAPEGRGRPLPRGEERFGREDLDQGDRPTAAVLERNSLSGVQARELLTTDPNEFAEVGGWMAVPKAVGDELMSAAGPAGLTGRLWDIGQGKFSRVLLGLGNVSWLAFQVGSNAFLTGLVGKVGPVSAIRAQRWWAGLSEAERAALRPYLGTTSHHADFDRKYLGATAANSRIVNTKRAMEKTGWWQAGRRANPIDAMFRTDAAQTAFFRRALLYNDVKRAAFRSMGDGIGEAVRLQDRVVGALTKSADEMVTGYLRDRRALERHAKVVDDILGDYLSYSKAERTVLRRVVMFYGFVRHSTRLALWTMPTKHPITAAIIGKLALLGADEMREILGGDRLPWGLGKFYFRGDSALARIADKLPLVDLPDDHTAVIEVDLARMNPAMNAFTEIRSAESLARVLPPFMSMAVEQVAEKSLMKGKDWRVGGRSQGLPNNAEPFTDYSLMDHLRVLGAQLEGSVPPARYARNVIFAGPQGDDSSLILGARPTGYKRPDVVRSIREQRERRDELGAPARVLQQVLPFVPRESEDPRILESRRKREATSGRRSRPGGGRGDFDRLLEAVDSPQGGGDAEFDRLLEAVR